MSLFSKFHRDCKSNDLTESIPYRYVLLVGVDAQNHRSALIVPYRDYYNEFDYMRLYSSYSFTILDIYPLVTFNTLL